jgi:glutamate-1-semialdehyde 2,1-aminomutase
MSHSIQTSQALIERASRVMPGGVNSPVRAFRSVGGTPPFIRKAQGAHMWDADGNQYIDYVLTWGPAILGHAHPEVAAAAKEAIDLGSSFGAPTEQEIDMAEAMIARVPGLDMVRLVSSGTEACMSAIRVARGVTGRHKIMKFDGCYHGHADAFLIGAGSGVLTFGLPNSPGVTPGAAQDTLLARFNDIDSVEALVQHNPDQIAAIIIEPICGNTGCIPPHGDFLADLRALCDAYKICLIFDEVMTGFRVARGGAAQLYGITPDMYCFGKVVGGGFPLAAYGGKREYMSQVAPAGPIYQAGTLSGNPVAVRAGLTTLNLLDDAAYATLERLGAQLEQGFAQLIRTGGYPLYQHRVGSMFGLFFHPGPVRTHDDVKQCDIKRFNKFYHAMLSRGIYLAPSQFEAGFLSTAHTPAMIDQTIACAEEALREVF